MMKAGRIIKRLQTALRNCLWLLALTAIAHAAMALELHGEPRQGALLLGKVAAEPGAVLTLDGTQVRITEGGDFAIGFDRDAPATAELVYRAGDGTETRRTLRVAQREYNIQRIEGVPQRTVTPPPEALQRIREESAMVRKARAQNSDRLDFLAGFEWPLTGPITGVFGSQRVYNGDPGRPHYGVDIAAPTGTPVRAPAAGRVVLTHPDMYFSGGTLIIDHGYGVFSTFIHLHQVLVEEGDEVASGDLIAEVGATGRATGPHLDWRINWYAMPLDPQTVVGAMPSAEQIAEERARQSGTAADTPAGAD